MRSFIACMLSLSCFSSIAQSPLTPGENIFEKKWIRNEHYQMTWYAMKDTTRFEMGKINTEQIVDDKQCLMITRVQMKNAKGPWIDSTIADIRTMSPIYHSSFNMQRDMVLHFGTIVTGYYEDKIKKTSTLIRDTTHESYFDSNLYPSLLRWLPLSEGYKREMLIYDYNPAGKIGVIKANVKSVSSGSYQSTTAGKRDVWILVVSDELGAGNSFSTYYIDKTDRSLWKQEINSGGRIMIIERDKP